MILKEFEVILHLLVIFNFAYVLADGFTKILNNQISGAFEFVRTEIEGIKGNIKLTKESLYQIRSVTTEEIDTSPDLDAAKATFTKLESKFKILLLSIATKIQNAEITKAFRYICLYAALYSLLLLLISGFCKEADHHSLINSIFIFNLLSSAFILYCVFYEREKTKILNLSFIRTIIVFFINIFIATILYLFLYKICYDKSWWGGLIITSFSILVPSLHFIIYSAMSLYKAHFIGNKMKNEMYAFNSEYEGFKDIDLRKISEWHEGYEKYRIQQGKK